MFRTSNKNLLPKDFGKFFEKIVYLLKTIVLFSLLGFLLICFVFYSSHDESLNTVSTIPSKHFLGYFGSYIADFLMQLFGFGSYFALLFFSFIPYVFFKNNHHKISVSFFVYFFVSVIFFSLFLNMTFALHGGFIVTLILNVLLHYIEFLNIRSFIPVISLVFLSFSLFCMFKAFHKTNYDMVRYVYRFIHLISWVGYSFMSIGQRVLRLLKKHVLKKDVVDDDQNEQDEVKITLGDVLKEKELPNMNIIEKFEKKEKIKTQRQYILEDNVNNTAFDTPSFDLLDDVPSSHKNKTVPHKELQKLAETLQGILEEFGIRGDIVNIRPGPVVTMYELKPAPGIKTSRVISLADDIARSMSALSARIAVIPGQNVIGIELPNSTRLTVYLKELLNTEEYQKTATSLPLILGKDIGGQAIVADLTRMPHLLVAGTTGSGKSVSVNAMILSILFKLPPEKCRFIMIDPKMLELSIYDDIPHLLTPVVTDPKKAVVALKWAVKEMENRYHDMSKLGVRNIDGYNARVEQARKSGEVLSKRVQTGFDPDTGKPIFESQNFNLEPLPYIIVVVDEMADLMLVAGKDIEAAVQRLAQMARAAGIHLIMATQRPSVDVITGTIKANFPTRISFMVTSKIDSRTILGEQGAEQLLGQGDMLYMAGGGRIQRVHGPFMKDEEVERVVSFLKEQGEPTYIEQVTQDLDEELSEEDDLNGDKDPMYQKALDIIRREGKVSTSFIQRHLSIGYNRAARIVDQMEAEGVVSPANHSGKREIL